MKMDASLAIQMGKCVCHASKATFSHRTIRIIAFLAQPIVYFVRTLLGSAPDAKLGIWFVMTFVSVGAERFAVHFL